MDGVSNIRVAIGRASNDVCLKRVDIAHSLEKRSVVMASSFHGDQGAPFSRFLYVQGEASYLTDYPKAISGRFLSRFAQDIEGLMGTGKKLKEEAPELAHVYFFNSLGADNTSKVIQAVRRRIRLGGVGKIIVASESGQLALQLERAFAHSTMVCVTYDDATRRKYRKPDLLKDQLLKQGIIVVDTVPEPLSRELTFRNWWERKTINVPGHSADLFWMTLICVGGHGFRTAVEIVFMAVEAGVVPVGERVVSVGGTGWGADSAIVMRASRFDDAVGEHPERRMKIEEILAMPKYVKWACYG